jgi:hypothetical protein
MLHTREQLSWAAFDDDQVFGPVDGTYLRLDQWYCGHLSQGVGERCFGDLVQEVVERVAERQAGHKTSQTALDQTALETENKFLRLSY